MSDISRRTILKGGAYTVPAIALLSMTQAKAEAASVPPVQNNSATLESNSTNVVHPSQTLPKTGTDVLPLVVAGGAAVAVGSAIVAATKDAPES
jgi:LPXTG-motif cell wall-anchored protein